MQKNWKPLEEWVIALGNNIFLQTRLRLTFFYLLILVVILAIFSQIIYTSFCDNIHHSVDFYSLSPDQEYFLVQLAEKQLLTTLIIVNFIILLIAGALSYFLAGKTLFPIQRALEEQKQFLSDASHELRTPIAILKTNLQVELEANNEKVHTHRENLKSNLEEVENMTKLVNDLLLLSRLDTHERVAISQIVTIYDILETVVKRMRIYSRSKNIEINIIDNELKLLEIEGDKELISSAFSNIIKNAIDYSSEKTSIEIQLKRIDAYFVVSIEDKGIGIPKEYLSHIFNRFYRVEKSRSKSISGTGLGLAIAQAIIRNHRGSITVKSEVNKGTIASISLPIYFHKSSSVHHKFNVE